MNEAALILEQIRLPMLGVSYQLEVDLRFRAGEFVALVGPSRSGKSVIIELAAGLVSPQEGRVILLGYEWKVGVNEEPSSIRLRLGTVLQQPGLLSNMTLFNNVALPLRYHDASMSERDRERVVMAQLEKLRLVPMRDRFPAELNQGEVRRGAIARALMLDPDVLLLDDPVAGLDAETVLTVTAYVEERRRARPLTDIEALWSYSSFIQESHHLLLLRNGRVEADGPPAALAETVVPTLKRYLGLAQ